MRVEKAERQKGIFAELFADARGLSGADILSLQGSLFLGSLESGNDAVRGLGIRVLKCF